MAELIKQKDGIIDFDILINGKKIKDTVEVQEIFIEMEVNRITSALLVIQDGGAIGVINEPFDNSEGNDFIPGNDIEISLGYIDNNTKVFKGIIMSQRLKIKQGESRLTIICKDKAINMTKGRFNAVFQNKTDSDAIKNIVSNYGLSFKMDATPKEHSVLMQYNCSDWDFIMIRAEANNMFASTYQNKLTIANIDFGASAKYEIKSSQIVIDIDLNLESEDMPSDFNMTSWNPESQEVVLSNTTISDTLGQGNLSAKNLSDVLKNSKEYYTSTPLEKDEMTIWLKSQVSSAILNKIKGTITIPGTTKIVAGDLIKLSEFSKRFNGKAFVSRVTHSLHDGHWLTELTLGKPSIPHASLFNIEDLGTSGVIPALRGTQIGTVKKIHEDPENNYRVLVTLPSLKGTGQEDGIWARLAFPFASADAGFFFFPEVDDEVLITFMNNDPRFPVITGSLYSPKNKPKEEPVETNQFKSIYSKSGIFIRFDEEDKILTLETPEKNSIELNDKEKSVSIKDMNDNSIIMDDSGITIKTPKDLNLKAQGNINIEATSNLAMEAKSDATLDGLSITHNAKTSFTAKGNASAELSASGQTTVKGAMVMIN